MSDSPGNGSDGPAGLPGCRTGPFEGAGSPPGAGVPSRGPAALPPKSARGRSVVLTGFMASGKSAVGRRLARKLGRDFVDTDRLIEERAGASIPQIFEERGEQGFRDLEHEIVASLDADPPVVVATGGGTFVFERNRELLYRLGPVVCIMVRIETVLERVTRNDRRPLARGEGAAERLTALYAERLPEYRKADILVESAGMSVDQTAARLRVLLKPWLAEADGPGRKTSVRSKSVQVNPARNTPARSNSAQGEPAQDNPPRPDAGERNRKP